MGLHTGKIMDYATKTKTCRSCDYAKRMDKIPTKHDCRKNHSGSSKAMEPISAVELFQNATRQGAKYSTYTGDDDSTTESYIRQKVPYGVEKFSDIIHIKRSLTTRLHNLSKMGKFKECSPLSSKVINYLAKCFSIVVAQNKGDSKSMKSSLKCIVPHAFGDHTNCSESWCRWKQDPISYKHAHLPYGKDLFGDALKVALEDLFGEYHSDIVVEKLAPAANSQRNESFNSVVGSKNPKIRCYGGSESNDFRVACAVAQTNAGYGYVCRTLEALGIDPGLNCTKHCLEMEKKKNDHCKRKKSLQFKKQRNHLHNSRINGTDRKEKREGKTYEKNIGLNLTKQPAECPTEEDLFTDVSEETLKTYERTVSQFTPRPQSQAKIYDANLFYNIILFDTETNTTGKAAQLCQISAIDKSGLNSFNEYVLPTKPIDKYASNVNKLSIRNINGKRTLFKETQAVCALTLQEALCRLLVYLDKTIASHKETTTKEICTVLIGHNSKRFDIPILLRNSDNEFHAKLKSLGIIFGDSLSLFDNLTKTKHPALNQSSGQSCLSNQSSLYNCLFEESFDAHDALEDVVALRRIMFSSRLQLSEELIVNQCQLVSCCDAIEDTRYLDKRHELLQTFESELYSQQSKDGAISKSMAEKIAGSGLSYDDLRRLFVEFGKKGLISILSEPPTAIQCSRKPRVTKTTRILGSILRHFQQLQSLLITS